MDSDPNRKVGRTDLSGELGSVPAPGETDPTPAVIRPGAGPASAMVTRSQARGGRGMKVEPEMEFRPEVEFRQEMDVGYRQKLVREVWVPLDRSPPILLVSTKYTGYPVYLSVGP